MPYVYLIQPKELIDTKRYKIGMSALGNLSRMRFYKSGSRYLFIIECSDAQEVERKLIKVFGLNYKLIAGNEYFECIDESEMINLFIRTVMEHKNAINRPDECNHSKNWMSRYAFK
jgi:hypothetical protein